MSQVGESKQSMRGVFQSSLLSVWTTPEGSHCPRAASGSMDLISTHFGDSLRRRVKEADAASSASSDDY